MSIFGGSIGYGLTKSGKDAVFAANDDQLG